MRLLITLLFISTFCSMQAAFKEKQVPETTEQFLQIQTLLVEDMYGEFFETIKYLQLQNLDREAQERRKVWFLFVMTYISLELKGDLSICIALWESDVDLQQYVWMLKCSDQNLYMQSTCKQLMHEHEPRFFVIVRDYLLDGIIPQGLTKESSLIKVLAKYRNRYDDIVFPDMLELLPILMVKELFQRTSKERALITLHCLWNPSSLLKKLF